MKIKSKIPKNVDPIKLADKIKNALVGLEGYGGGHDYACGTCVKDKDFNVFLERFKSELK